MKLQKGKETQWKDYVETHATGYERTVIMFAETIAEILQKNGGDYLSLRLFERDMKSAIEEAAKQCGIRTSDEELANSQANQAIYILLKFWEDEYWIRMSRFHNIHL